MRKWLIGLGGLVLLRVVSGLHPAEPDRMTGHVPSHWDRAGSATLPIGEVWRPGLSLGRLPRPDCHPTRRQRLSKKARRKLVRRLRHLAQQLSQ